MAKYKFEENAIFYQKNKADPDVIGKAFEDIARKHDNNLWARDVLDEARRRTSPLHRHFIWETTRQRKPIGSTRPER